MPVKRSMEEVYSLQLTVNSFTEESVGHREMRSTTGSATPKMMKPQRTPSTITCQCFGFRQTDACAFFKEPRYPKTYKMASPWAGTCPIGTGPCLPKQSC